jgi:hypothetical protein
VSFRSDIAIYRQGLLWFQNNKDTLFKVMIGLVEPMRGGDTIRCLLMSHMGGSIYNGVQEWGSRVQDGSMVILTQFRIQRYKPLVEINRDKINTPSCC